MRRDSETLRSAGDGSLYDSNLLVAAVGEGRIAHLRQGPQEAVAVLRRFQPIAERLGAQARLSPPELYALFTYHSTFARCMRDGAIGPLAERIELDRKANVFARRRAELDPGDGAAQIVSAQTLGALAHDFESVDPAKAARYYREAIEDLSRLPDLVAANIAWKVALYIVGQNGIRFFLRRQEPVSAVDCARRVSAVVCPALFLRLNLPRSGEVANLQGLWWAASEASAQKAKSATNLWTQALRDAEAGLQTAANDAMMQASGALVFEGLEAETYRARARSLWRSLGAVYPQNDFIRKRLAGEPVKHTGKESANFPASSRFLP
jgi:hypothetical protein